MRLAHLSPAAHRMNPPSVEHDHVAGLAGGTTPVLALGATPRPRAGLLLPRARSTSGAAARAFLRASGPPRPCRSDGRTRGPPFHPQPCRGWRPAAVPTRDRLCWRRSLGSAPPASPRHAGRVAASAATRPAWRGPAGGLAPAPLGSGAVRPWRAGGQRPARALLGAG